MYQIASLLKRTNLLKITYVLVSDVDASIANYK